MTDKYSRITDDNLDELLNELSFTPDGKHALSHQAPAGLQQRILAARSSTVNPEAASDSAKTSWLQAIDPFPAGLLSPWRAFAASAATLLFGVLLGSATPAAQLYTAALGTTTYPESDELLVIASLDDDFSSVLGNELIQDWGQTEPASATTNEVDNP